MFLFMAVSAGDENVDPILPPPLLRQETAGPDDFGVFNTGVVVNGQFEAPQFDIRPDGYWGMQMQEIESILVDDQIMEDLTDDETEEEVAPSGNQFLYDSDSGDEYEKEDLTDDETVHM